jgi:hypothetical protein
VLCAALSIVSCCSPRGAFGQPAVRAGLLSAQAEAARTMILLGVQQAYDSLPPASSQSFLYRFDFGSDVPVRSVRLGPTAFRSPELLGDGQLDLRFGVSYFEMSERFAPIFYQYRPAGGGDDQFYTQFGLDVSADVLLFNLSTNYGVTSWLEARLVLPLAVVDASGSQIFYVLDFDADAPPADALIAFAPSPAIFDDAVASGEAVRRQASFAALGLDSFGAGGSGIGRIQLGAKARLLRRERIKVAFDMELLLPSPDEDELAGPDSAAILPRIIAAADITDWLRAYADAGYEYDFDEAVLRRFTWSAGLSLPFSRATFDLGFGGSQFAEALEWTPDVAPVSDPPGSLVKLAGEDNTLGTTAVDVLVGAKVKLQKRFVLSGTVSVPIDDREFRPAALGTVAAEIAF